MRGKHEYMAATVGVMLALSAFQAHGVQCSLAQNGAALLQIVVAPNRSITSSPTFPPKMLSPCMTKPGNTAGAPDGFLFFADTGHKIA